MYVKPLEFYNNDGNLRKQEMFERDRKIRIKHKAKQIIINYKSRIIDWINSKIIEKVLRSISRLVGLKISILRHIKVIIKRKNIFLNN